MAAYRRVDGLKSPAGWHRDQLRAQRSVTSMGELLPFDVTFEERFKRRQSASLIVCVCVCELLCSFYSPAQCDLRPERITVQRGATSIKQVLLDWCKQRCNAYTVIVASLFISVAVYCFSLLHNSTVYNKKHLKNVGPIRHCEPPHAHSPGVATGTVAHRLRIDVHDDNDDNNNDNAWQRGPLWPHRMGPMCTRACKRGLYKIIKHKTWKTFTQTDRKTELL